MLHMVCNKTYKKLALAMCLISMLTMLFACGQNAAARWQEQYDLGQKYLTELDYEQAIIAFTNAIEVDDKLVDAYIGRAMAYAAINEYESAKADYGRAMELEPSREEEIRSAMENSGIPQESYLTEENIKWLVEPTYTFEDVEPIYSYDFYRDGFHFQAGFANGRKEDIKDVWSVELNFPTYSYLDEYYSITDNDKKMLFYMPDRLQSEKYYISRNQNYYISSDYGITYDFRISNDEDSTAQRLEKPWNALLTQTYPGPSDVGSGWNLVYDTQLQKAFYFNYYMDEYNLVPINSSELHKPYAVACFNSGETSLNGDTPVTRLTDDTIFESIAYSPKYALWDSNSHGLLTEPVYDAMGSSSDGITAACLDGKWGYLNAQGNEITEFVYDAPWNWMEQSYIAYPCTCDTMVVSKEGQIGLLYRDGSLLLDFGQFEDLAPAWNNQLWAKQDGLWGLIDLADAKAKLGLPEWDTAKPYDADRANRIPKQIELAGLEVQPDAYYPYQYDSEDNFYIVRAKPNLSMRTGPGTEYERIAVIPDGYDVEVYSPEKNGWVVVFFGDQYGWVSKEYLE